MSVDVHREPLRVLPPWLAFWLFVYLIALPSQVRDLWIPTVRMLLSSRSQPGETMLPFARFFRLVHVAELAPMLLLALGVFSLGFPGLRGRRNRRVYGLQEPPDLPVVWELRAFLSAHAPKLQVKMNLLRTDLLAFVTPSRWGSSTLALFGGMILLWRRDREAAEAVMLHESAHVRQGDAFAVGVGSAFVRVLDLWLPLVIVLVVLPMVLIWGYDAFNFVRGAGELWLGWSLDYKLDQMMTQYLPGLGWTVMGLLLSSIGTISLPLVSLWCAELSADHAAAAGLGSPAALIRGLDGAQRRERSPGRWLLSAMTHPPRGFRRWLATRTLRFSGEVILLLLFPMTYLAKGGLLLLRAVGAHRLVGTSGVEMGRMLVGYARVYLRSIAPVWVGMVVFLLVWPALDGLVRRKRPDMEVYLPYGIVALGLVGVGLVMWCGLGF